MTADPQTYATAASALLAADSVAVTTHLNPDGDGIGAGLALLLALEGLGKRVEFLCPSAVASMYAFLPEFSRIAVVEDLAVAKARAEVDVLISCDCGDLQRLGAVASVPRKLLINLDHHASNTNFGDVNLVDLDAESSGVAVQQLLVGMGVTVDRAMAECLYTTIIFDTGRFMHSNTTARSLRWTADLLDTGIDSSRINRLMTYTRTPGDLAVQRFAMGKLVVDPQESRVAGIAFTQEDMAAEKLSEPEDWGDLVEVPRSLRGNEVAFLARQRVDKEGAPIVKLSLRSNPPYAVGPVAQHFGGGGHLQAAGATVPGTLAQILPDLLPRLRAVLG